MRAIYRTLAVLVALLPLEAAFASDLFGRPGGEVRSVHAGSMPLPFYLRADVGVAAHDAGRLSQSDLAENGGSFLSKSIGDSTVVGFGIGKQISRNFRIDLTGEYRGKAEMRALDHLSASLTSPDGTLEANTLYEGRLSAIVGLMNVYADLVTWRGLTPYVGGGIGIARTKLSGITTLSTATFTEDVSGAITTQVTPGTGGEKSQFGLAWALMAGVSADIGSHAKLDIGYRYLNLGSNVAASTGLLDCVCGTVGQPLKLHDLDAHEIRIGLRVPLGSGPSALFYQPLK